MTYDRVELRSRRQIMNAGSRASQTVKEREEYYRGDRETHNDLQHGHEREFKCHRHG